MAKSSGDHPETDGPLRFSEDYRNLNVMKLKGTYPLPRMEDCPDSLKNAQYFTALDCNAGYWRVLIALGDRKKTTFTCHEGWYQFCRMPFGICNAPATFQRAVDILLSKYRLKTCLMYLNDIIVISKSQEDHIKHVGEVMCVLCDTRVTLKLNNCTFFSQSVDYLGHIIYLGKLKVAIKNMKPLEGFK